MKDLSRLTATETARLLRQRRISAADLMAACLDRIACREGGVKAFAWLDPAEAMRRAEQADRAPHSGPLHGLPLGVKDIFDTADMPTEYGSPIWSGHRPRADAAAVMLARNAGALTIGKTVTTEFAWAQPGPTTNPANAAHTPGGSSSGSAAGVADGFFPLALGTQTAGSIIRPASFCGVVGYKPSFGTISRAGVKVLSESLDTIGVFARSVADCALLVGAMAGIKFPDLQAKPAHVPRFALCRSPAPGVGDTVTAALSESVGSALRRAGAKVREIELPEELSAAFSAHPRVMNGESAQAFAWELAKHRDLLSPVILGKLGDGLAQPFETLRAARAILSRARRIFPDVLAGFDALITPAAPGEAPRGLSFTGDPTFNLLWTGLYAPCVTVPCGAGPNGLPLGIQIVSPQGSDDRTLIWAAWVQAAVEREPLALGV